MRTQENGYSKIAVINLTLNTQFLDKIKECFIKHEIREYANYQKMPVLPK